MRQRFRKHAVTLSVPLQRRGVCRPFGRDGATIYLWENESAADARRPLEIGHAETIEESVMFIAGAAVIMSEDPDTKVLLRSHFSEY